MIGPLLGCLDLGLFAVGILFVIWESRIFRGGSTHVEEDAVLYEQHRRLLLGVDAER